MVETDRNDNRFENGKITPKGELPMKQIIIMTAMVTLGILIFQMVAGDGKDSMKESVKTVWKKEIVERMREEP